MMQHKTSILDDLRSAQSCNEKARIAEWKGRIHADSQSQRNLIIRAASQRFFKASLVELQQKVQNKGQVRKTGNHLAHQMIARPESAPADMQKGDRQGGGDGSQEVKPTKKLSRQSSWSRFIPPRQQTGDASGRAKFRPYDTLESNAARRAQFLASISTSFNQDEHIIERGLQSELSMRARDARLAFSSLVKALPGAQLHKLFADGTSRDRQRIAHEEKRKVADKRPPNKGIALLLDPSIDTRGKIVTLHVRFDDSLLAGATQGPSPLNTARTGSRPSSRGQSLPAATHRRPASSPSPTGHASYPSLPSPEPVVRASSAQAAAPSPNPNPVPSSAAAPRPSPARPKRTIRERTYRLRSRGRFDLTVTTNAVMEVSSHSSEGGGTYDAPIDDYLETYLPGWEGVLPIYVTGNVCVCHIEVADDPHAQQHQQRSPSRHSSASAFPMIMPLPLPVSPSLSPSPSAASLPRPVSAAAYISEKCEEERRSNVVVASVCAFPCRSKTHALHLLHSHMAGVFRVKTANVTVPGGIPALSVAAFHGNLEAVRRLIENGASVNLKASIFPKDTALHEAVLGGHEDIVHLLLDKGAKQTVPDDAGNCAIHMAALYNNVRVARILLSSDGAAAVLARRNSKHKLALDLATSVLMRSALETGMRSFGISGKNRM